MMLDATKLLEFWESARESSPHRFALALLDLAMPANEKAHLRDLTLGERDRLLCELRRAWFASDFESSNPCSACGTPIEVQLDLGELCRTIEEPCSRVSMLWQGKVLNVRARKCGEALELEESAPGGAGFTQGSQGGSFLRTCLADSLPDDEIALLASDSAFVKSLAEQMEIADPFSYVTIATKCPECQHPQSFRFDPVLLLRHDFSAWADGLMEDVHRLAQSYSWSEKEILELPAWRRAWYRDRVSA